MTIEEIWSEKPWEWENYCKRSIQFQSWIGCFINIRFDKEALKKINKNFKKGVWGFKTNEGKEVGGLYGQDYIRINTKQINRIENLYFAIEFLDSNKIQIYKTFTLTKKS